ncbi:MAG: histidinol-phosphatase [Clostridia bacterium]|nr:histidinol-phosphatase [Clostridia bacterium]
MIANYHTHTPLCHHADGTMRDYVEVAVERGLETLGFACHTPYPFPDGYDSGFRMSLDDQKTYVDTILELREEFKDKINILIGYEAEYYPALFGNLLDALNRYPCDYIIMGQHFTKNEYDGGFHTFGGSDDINDVHDYVRQTSEAMRLGVYTYFAHPDMMSYKGDLDEYLDAMRGICLVAKETDTPLEINMLGLGEGRSYPKRSFFKMAAACGCRAVIGCDAHSPKYVADPERLKMALDFADECGIEVLETVELRRPVLTK